MRISTALSLSLALWAGAARAQNTLLTLPAPGSTLTAGCNFTVQIGMPGYPENIDVVAIVIGLAPCYGGQCWPSSAFVGTPLYQGPYVPAIPDYYQNVTLTVPEWFPAGNASVNAINFFMVGAEYIPIVDYLNNVVTVVAGA